MPTWHCCWCWCDVAVGDTCQTCRQSEDDNAIALAAGESDPRPMPAGQVRVLPLCRLCNRPLVDLTDYDRTGAHLSCLDARARLDELVQTARDIIPAGGRAKSPGAALPGDAKSWSAVDREGCRD